MNRRSFIQTSAAAGVGALAIESLSCGPNLDPKFQIALTILQQITATLNELHITGPLGLIAKVTKVITDVQTFYKNGNFPDAISTLNEVIATGGLFDQILADANVAVNNTIKGFLIAFRGALTVIAVILADQASHPAVVQAMATLSANDTTKVENVRKLADGKRIDAALKALKF